MIVDLDSVFTALTEARIFGAQSRAHRLLWGTVFGYFDDAEIGPLTLRSEA